MNVPVNRAVSTASASAQQSALTEAKSALQRGDTSAAESHLLAMLDAEPVQAEALRLMGVLRSMQGRHHEAIEHLRRTLALCDDDPLAHNSLGSALGQIGDKAAAAAAFARACELAPRVAPFWYNRGKALSEDARNTEAIAVLEQALRLAPDDLRVRFLYAQNLRASGQTDEAADVYRAVLRTHPDSGEAWLGLSNLKRVRFDAADVAEMERAMGTELDVDDQMSIRFALARGYEDLSRYHDAYRTYVDANARVRQWYPWDAAAFSAHVEALIASAAAQATAAAGLGSEAIFIVSMPRAGSSLIEQILASHPKIDGAGELNDLPAVLHEESQRRGVAFPHWTGGATVADWQRLGAQYLARTARWRDQKPFFTDKLPDNWQHVGIIAAMLSGARIVICEREPLETALACWRQLFSGGAQAFSYNLHDLAAYWRDFRRAVEHWRSLYPDRVRVQSYEALVADTETEVRNLLAFCGLSFDAACLRFYETPRNVRTASAGQVREPLRRDTARAAKYGSLLDPLRAALGLPPFAPNQT